MKKLALSLLAGVAIVAAAFFGARSVAYAAYTKQSTRVDRVELNVTYDAAGAINGVTVNAQMQTKLLVNDADSTDTVPAPWRPVAFNLLAVGNTTAATKTCNGTQVAALLRQMVLDQAAAQGVQ